MSPVSAEKTGMGLFSEIGKRILGLKHGLLNGYRTNFGPEVRAVLEAHGNKKITKVIAGRHPLSTRIESVVRVFGRNLPETIYHLFMVMILEDGTRILNEKNEVLKIQVFGNSMAFDQMEFVLPNDTTLNQFLEKTRLQMGTEFTHYSAMSFNCQNYVLNSLTANGINLTPQQRDWIIVDARNFSNEFWKTLANGATNLASIWDLVKRGEGRGQRKRFGALNRQLLSGLRKAQNGAGIKDVIHSIFGKLAGWVMDKFFNVINEDEGIVHSEQHTEPPTSSIDQGRYMDDMIKKIKGSGKYQSLNSELLKGLRDQSGSGIFDFLSNFLSKIFSKTYSDTPDYGIPYSGEHQTNRIYKY